MEKLKDKNNKSFETWLNSINYDKSRGSNELTSIFSTLTDMEPHGCIKIAFKKLNDKYDSKNIYG